jgi:adenylyltransferase/sulfurtransferase
MSEPLPSQQNVRALPGRVLVIGAGGLSSPALAVLAKSGVTEFSILDDDHVDASNLHRQTLYEEADAGAAKAEVAARRLRELSPFAERVRAHAVVERLTPDNALSWFEQHDLVLEGADNFATKFLAADAAKLTGKPIVQAGAVRFSGWALASLPLHGACMRCVFEDIPRGQPESCAAAGVLGPVVGVLGALEAALALQLLLGDESAASALYSYEALSGTLRKRHVLRRPDCALCTGQITDLRFERYDTSCAA